MIHELKIEDNYLTNLKSGEKKVEIRINDRDYQKGDILQFRDHRDGKLPPVGDPNYYLYFEITHIHSGLGMDGWYVALSVKPVQGD